MNDDLERRVLVFAPFGKDAALAADALRSVGLANSICHSVAEVVQQLGQGAAALLSVEEALPAGSAEALVAYLQQQPTWSDLPVLVLTKPGGNSHWVAHAHQMLGNLTLLERPVRASTLISATRSALRARLRQYEVRVADQRKDEFLAMLAHELRNPLAPIGAAVQLVHLDSGSSNRTRQAADVIGRQVEHMKGLIDDLLDVARVTRGLAVFEKQPHDLRRVLAEAVEQVSPMMRMRAQHLALQQPPQAGMVLGDYKRLVQVAGNLLNNASKYTPEGGRITAGLRVTDTEVVLEVADNGIGMTPELLARVFEMFAQGERTADRAQGGLGIGLALVDKLVGFHGGRVVARSDGLGKGSLFSVYLPRHVGVADQDAVNSKGAVAEPQAAAATRVMVVDDNTDAADMLKLVLEAHGYQVAVEYSAATAIARAQAFGPRVCLLDIGLPDMDGNQLARKLRQLPGVSDAVLLAVTGYGQPRDSENAIAAGFDEHLVKPVDMDHLLSRLTHHLA